MNPASRPSPRAEQALQDYIGLGETRSLAALLHHYRSQLAAKAPPTRRLETLKLWSVTYHWGERALQHDAQLLAQQAQLRQRTEQETLEREHAAALARADALEAKADEAVKALSPQQLAANPVALCRVVELASAIRHRERGEPSSIVRTEQTGPGGAPIAVNLTASPEWLDLRSRLLAALRPYPGALQAALSALREDASP
jgi:hypothetical protein